ncbi:hypothetical protein JCM17478_25940 [Thermopirellula anaerolimosa]
MRPAITPGRIPWRFRPHEKDFARVGDFRRRYPLQALHHQLTLVALVALNPSETPPANAGGCKCWTLKKTITKEIRATGVSRW